MIRAPGSAQPVDRRAKWLASWDADGYIVRPGLLDPAEVASLLESVQQATPLDDGPNELSAGPMEFRSNLFHRSAALQAVLTDPRVVELVCAILGPDVWCRWDQAVCKRPGAGWFPWHQDNGYTHLPNVHLQLWFALTASVPSNGGLLVAPGLHTELLPHVWEAGHARIDPGDLRIDHDDGGLPIVARAGDALAFSSLLPHATGPNISATDRWAYVAEFLPLTVADDTVPTPHFVVACGGRPAPAFVDLRPQWAGTVETQIRRGAT